MIFSSYIVEAVILFENDFVNKPYNVGDLFLLKLQSAESLCCVIIKASLTMLLLVGLAQPA